MQDDNKKNDEDDAYEYDVLYWKRKWGSSGKSAKNNAKVDGVLSVQPLTSKIVLRGSCSSLEEDEGDDTASSSEDDEDESEPSVKKKKGARLWQQRKQQQQKRIKSAAKQKPTRAGCAVVISIVQREIAARAETLSEDDVVAVGAYDVQILNRRVTSTQVAPSKQKPLVSHQLPARKPLTSRTSLLGRSKGTSVKKIVVSGSVQPKASARSGSLANGQYRSFVSKKPPAQPQKDQNLKNPLQPKSISARTALVVASSGAANTKPAQTAKNLRRPLQKPLSTISSSNLQKTISKNNASSTPSLAFATTHNNSIDTAVWSTNISVPNSLRMALRPHQVTAVQFLFDALTTKRGAILAGNVTAVCCSFLCLLLLVESIITPVADFCSLSLSPSFAHPHTNEMLTCIRFSTIF